MAKKKSKQKKDKNRDKKKDLKKKKLISLKLREKKASKKKDSKKKVSKKKEPKKKDLKKKDSKKKGSKKKDLMKVERTKELMAEKPSPVTSVKPEVKNTRNEDHSSNYNVTEAVKKIRLIKSKEKLLSFTKGEKRVTITQIIPPILSRLK